QYKLFRASNISLSLSYNIQDGPGGNANGIGDLLLSLTQELFNNDKSAFDIIFGAKLATGNENKERLLPQVYQPGLGSNDFIFAANYYYKNFGFGAGYQLNGGRNDKENLKLKRGDDLMLRTNYSFSLNDFQFNPQLIFIKQLSESSILDLNSSGENFIEIENSDQSQLNFLFLVDYLLNENYSLFGEVAIPFLKRDINIDGLKRAYTFFLGFRFSY
ncbi:MAG TPA: hypothetical protein VLN45_12025, partial [Ignavibacteriaceae bacterium]|nr:hypothetical protein [Ignavibacteriaceae bacterium]